MGSESQVDNPGCNSPLDGVSQERERERERERSKYDFQKKLGKTLS